MDGLYGLLMILFASPDIVYFIDKNCVSQIEKLESLDVEKLIKTYKAQELIGKDYREFEGACLRESIPIATLSDFVWDFKNYSQWENQIIKRVDILNKDEKSAEVKLYYDFVRKSGEHEFLDSQLLFERKKLSDRVVCIQWNLSKKDYKKGFDIHSGIWYFIKLAENETLIFHFTRIDLHKKYKYGFIPLPEGFVNGMAIEKAVLRALTDLHKGIRQDSNLEQMGMIKNEAIENHVTKNN